MPILNKKQMSEEDIKLNYITPAVQNCWKGHEHYFAESKSSNKAEQKSETDEDGFMQVPEGEHQELPFN